MNRNTDDASGKKRGEGVGENSMEAVSREEKIGNLGGRARIFIRKLLK